MRTIRNLPIPQDGNNIKFPSGQIRNETTTESGTPVVREIYGDIITNIYKIIKDTGIDFTETEDSEDSQYQLLDALKKFSNNINDLQQILTVNSNDINVSIDFDNLPNKYLFIGKITDSLYKNIAYNINSLGNNIYPVTIPQNISASSLVLVILNSNGSTIIDLSSKSAIDDSVNTSFGSPLSFNSSNKMLYLSQGLILTNIPEVYKVEQLIQANLATSDVIVVDSIFFKNKLICFTFNIVTLKYQAFSFDISDLNTLEGEIVIPDISGVDNQPYIFCDGSFLYFTNSNAIVNNSVNDYSIGKFSFDEVNLVISNISFFNLHNSFEKTTNTFIDASNQIFYSLINGTLKSYKFDGSPFIELAFFNTINGQVFKFNGSTYYTNGELGTKWSY